MADYEGLDEFAEEQQNVQIGQNVVAGAVNAVPQNGGVLNGTPWTGGSRDPANQRITPLTPLCSRSDQIGYRVWNRCEKGVEDEWKIKLTNTIPLSTCEPVIQAGLENVGVDSVFWIERDAGNFVNLFKQPDVVPIEMIRAHEDELRGLCQYDSANLHYSRVFLENSVDMALRRKMTPSLLPSDGGPAFWSLVKMTLQGAETSKLIRHQAIIKDTKLVDFPGYDIAKFHEVLVPSLNACNEANHLPLNVGPKVIENHIGPRSIGYTAVLSNFAGEQANLHDSQRQFNRLIPQMNSLLNISLNDPDWEKVEAPKGAYTSKLRQQDIICYQCNQKGHVKKDCPNKKQSKKNNGKSNGGKKEKKNQQKNDDGGLEKRWYNKNEDNKTTMEHEGTLHYWCPSCSWGRGRWVDDHKPEDCRHKKSSKKASESTTTNKEGGFLVMDLVDSGFMAIEFL